MEEEVHPDRYECLFSKNRDQDPTKVFAFFPPDHDKLTAVRDFDAPWVKLAENTLEGREAWEFTSDKYRNKYRAACPKLKNYLQYTFVRLKELEKEHPGHYFTESADQRWVCFNTGLQDRHSSDLYSIFEKYEERRPKEEQNSRPDWLYRGTLTSREPGFRSYFGIRKPDLAWYSVDSRDFVFDISYSIDIDLFGHMFDRAKERSGFPADATEELVHNYLRGTIENLMPKIRRNYKTAIPMYYVEEMRMQLLLPFMSYDGRHVSCLLVQRDDINRCYAIKTVLEIDQAYFAARLITRPDKEWLNP